MDSYKEINGQKVQSISSMRVLAMLMIVLFHSLLFYTGTWTGLSGPIIPFYIRCANFLDASDLSMFVFVSGFLFGYLYLFEGKYRNKKIFIVGKFRRLLIPYILWGILLVLLHPSYYNWTTMYVGISHLWFLLMLMWIFLFAIIIVKYVKKTSIIFDTLFLPFCYMLFILSCRSNPHHFFLSFETSLSYLVIFWIGFFCAKHKLWKGNGKYALIVFGLSFLLLTIICFFLSESFLMKYDLIVKCISYCGIVSLFIILNNTDLPFLLNGIINRIDPLCMGIYIFNQIVINEMLWISNINKWLNVHYKFGPICIFLVSLFFPAFFSWLFNKYRWLSWTIGTYKNKL